ncbi:MAG: ribonuclease J, partial [Deltaproteobacteria bacterium]|nr:ribonuclease J [Deltaproteobacteria bacterium]MBW2323512.1 ribonuclease J [Deltaproteobacteria bacterium]
ISKGFIFEESKSHVLEDAKCLILEIFDRLAEERNSVLGQLYDLDEIKSEIRRELKRFFNQVIERRPLILPQIITI